MKEIVLHNGMRAVVDDADYGMLVGHKWQAQRDRGVWYAVSDSRVGGKIKRLFMHRMITGAQGKMHVDHCDHDGLNNRRSNLRICTAAQNACNRKRLPKHNTSGFIGVSFAKGMGKFLAYINSGGKTKILGGFDDPIEAAKARDRAAKALYGEYAFLNFQ